MTVFAAALSALALTMAADATAAPQAAGQAAGQVGAPAQSSIAAGTLPSPGSQRLRIVGVSPAATVAWLGTQGLTVGPLQQDEGRQYVRVDADGLAWLLFFQSCENGLCSDVQFSTAITNAAVTPEGINGWNRDRRFLKAIYEAPEGSNPPSAVVQYDVLLNNGGPEQLGDHLSIWRGLLPQFVRLTTGAPAATPAPAAH